MSRLSVIVLVFAAALMLAGCGQPVWQRPIGHPADPQEPAGQLPSFTVFERYRSDDTVDGFPKNEPVDPGQMHHGGTGQPDDKVHP